MTCFALPGRILYEDLQKRCRMDKELFEELYLTLYPGFFRLAQSILRNTADAEDVVQQSAEKAWRARERIHTGNEKAYLTRIVINECRTIQRRRMRMTAAASVEELDRACSEADRTESCEVRAMLDSLPEKLRLPLLLRYMEGYSEEEAAAALRIPRNTLKSRLRKAKEAMKNEWMEPEEEKPDESDFKEGISGRIYLSHRRTVCQNAGETEQSAAGT